MSEARRLRQLEDENRRLKQMVADQALDLQALRAVLAKKWRHKAAATSNCTTSNEAISI